MKKVILPIVFLLLSFGIKSQNFVTIPDANFVTFLQTIVPAAMSGNQLDTTHVAVTTTTYSVDVYNLSISDLTGIQYFKSLTYLDCQNNLIAVIPALSPVLSVLHCAGNSLTSLPNLPGTLQDLSCSFNSLTSLPNLPPGLKTLACANNSLPALPNLSNSLTYLDCSTNLINNISQLPPMLTYLDCSSNNITGLPTLPTGLVTLFCAYDNLSSLPSLPNSITWIKCGANLNLTTLPTLPTSLITLECPDNYFTSLPAFPNSVKTINIYNTFNLTTYPAWPTSLQYLDANHGYQITSYPSSFPNSLQRLNCSNTPHLKSIPTLPNGLLYLNTAFDSIYCFPVFPAATTTLSILPNDVVNCLPNYTGAMDAATLAYPLCGSGNPNGCPVAVGIEQMTENSNISIYPNPTAGEISIANVTEDAVLNVFDLNGKSVRMISLKRSEKPQKVDLTNLENGVYFYSMSTFKKEQGARKIVIIK